MPLKTNPLLNLPESDETDFANWLVNQNRLHAGSLKFNFWNEMWNFARFSKTMIWAYPTARIMRWKIRRNKELRHILQYPELLPVRNNIEKGSFAYDSILFKETIFSLLKNKSHLANLVCLAILFGDEFIDGIAETYGKPGTAALLTNPQYDFNLQYRKEDGRFCMFYAFDICQLLPQNVLETTNKKYEITYLEFYRHLLYLLAEMNRHLHKLPVEKAEEAAKLICHVCNLCFNTYKTDITEFNEHYTLEELLEYQKTKDDDIIHFLLTLRAELLDKKQLQYQKNFTCWSSMVRSMQLYDDMEDAAKDCDFQMNSCCWFARNYFPKEWEWLQENKLGLRLKKGLKLNAAIALHMPGSCMLSMQYARNLATSKLSWVQRKITNYLWRKNWLGFNNPLLNTGFSIQEILGKKEISVPMQLHFILQKINTAAHETITDTMKKNWALDIALMDGQVRKYIFNHISRKERYFLTSCFLEWDENEKAEIWRKVS